MKFPDPNTSFANLLERAISTLEAENTALLERQPYRIAELHARKSMVLYELERTKTSAAVPGIAAVVRIRSSQRHRHLGIARQGRARGGQRAHTTRGPTYCTLLGWRSGVNAKWAGNFLNRRDDVADLASRLPARSCSEAMYTIQPDESSSCPLAPN